MSEASYLVELREAAPQAPERLRELVRDAAARPTAPGIASARALVAAAALGVGVGVAGGAASAD